MPKRINIIGKKFERLYVLEQSKKGYRTYCKCRCDCGNITYVAADDLTMGKTRSCGCLRTELNRLPKKHGMTKTRIYYTYRDMLKRCYLQSSTGYENYGGRGICVCDEWLNNFETFYKWAIDSGYSDELTIDRIDVNGNYEPSNCRWATRKEQNNNRRNSIILKLNGETHTTEEWSIITGINVGTIRSRHKAGWSDKDVLTKPVKQKQNEN